MRGIPRPPLGTKPNTKTPDEKLYFLQGFSAFSPFGSLRVFPFLFPYLF
jgi:hypothetical protein